MAQEMIPAPAEPALWLAEHTALAASDLAAASDARSVLPAATGTHPAAHSMFGGGGAAAAAAAGTPNSVWAKAK